LRARIPREIRVRFGSRDPIISMETTALQRKSLGISRRSVLAGAAATFVTPAISQTLTPVEISQAILIANYTPVYLAQQRGLFAKQGLDVSISTAGGIATVVPIILSKRAQFALSGTAPAVNATLGGGPTKCIANIAGGSSLLVLAKPGTSIRSLEDFKGKTIATLRFPSNTNATPKYALTKIGKLDLAASNVSFLELPPGAQIAAVKDGRADLAVVFEWDASIGATQHGLEVVYGFADVIGPNASSAIFATQQYLDANAETAQKLVNAIAEAMKMIHTDPGAYETASATAFPSVPKDAIALGSKRLLAMHSVVPRNPIITKESWDRVMTMELGTGLKQSLPFEQMVDNSFAEKATDAFGLKS
jgi:NitT/TauT family transport system substrate-binding protein